MLELPELSPNDAHNRELLANVHPPDWVNPRPEGRYNLVVLGAGTAGLVAAAGAAGLGAKVALVERYLMGGDCLNVGCVPSKTLIRAARAVSNARSLPDLGVRIGGGLTVDFPAVMERVRRVRADICPHDSARRFRDVYGVDVYLGAGRFGGPDVLEVDGRSLRFDRALIATGARPAVPPIPGLAEAGFLTNETVFNLTELPTRMAVLGGGPIGCELAQAFARLGSRVTLVEISDRLLAREEPEAAAVLLRALEGDGVDVRLKTELEEVEFEGSSRLLRLRHEGAPDCLEVDAVLVAVGRSPNVEGLGLEVAGVRVGGGRVEVDDHLRTANSRIFAAGDVCSEQKFTHAADFMARAVVQNAFFPLVGRKKASSLNVPRCTYTDPEIAHVGLTTREADDAGIELATFTVAMAEVDRCVAEGETEGFASIRVRAGSDRIVGATIAGSYAGEMISEVAAAMAGGLGLGDVASVIHPYPTRTEAIRKAGDLYNRTRLTEFRSRLLRRYFAWRRR